MLSFDTSVLTPLWQALQSQLPPHVDNHPLGCHNPRTEDLICFTGIILKEATGMSWDDVALLLGSSRGALTRRRNEWERLGVIEDLFEQSIRAIDKFQGLDLSSVSLDGSQQKAPGGGDGSGPSPVDRGKSGYKWSILTDRRGVMIGYTIAAANVTDLQLLEQTLLSCPPDIRADIGILLLDKGYDAKVARDLCKKLGIAVKIRIKKKKRTKAQIAKDKQAEAKAKKEQKAKEVTEVSTTPVVTEATPPSKQPPHTLGLRWPVERTNAWLAAHGQVRRSYERKSKHRQWWFALAALLIHTSKLVAMRKVHGLPEALPKGPQLAWSLGLNF